MTRVGGDAAVRTVIPGAERPETLSALRRLIRGIHATSTTGIRLTTVAAGRTRPTAPSGLTAIGRGPFGPGFEGFLKVPAVLADLLVMHRNPERTALAHDDGAIILQATRG